MRKKKFLEIKEKYKEYYGSFLKKGKYPLRDTEVGLWGTVDLDIIFDFFTKIKLQNYNHFLDLGSGDGCVVMVASLFTDATGIEYDKELHEVAKDFKKDLKLKTNLRNGDYLKANLKKYDCFFIFPDNDFKHGLEKKLLKDMDEKAKLFVYQKIHSPLLMKKGKTYWFNQVPIITYKNN